MSFPGPLTIYIHYVILTYRKKTTMDALYDSFSKKFGMRNIKKLTKQVVRHCSNEGLWDIPISNEKIALILANFLGFASVREMFNYYADLKQVKTADISLLYDRYKEVQDKKRQKPAPTPASDSVKSANNVMAEAKAQTPSKSLKPAIDNYDVFAGKFGMNFGELLKSTVYPVDEARYNVILSLSNLDEQALSFANFFGFRTVSNMLTYF